MNTASIKKILTKELLRNKLEAYFQEKEMGYEEKMYPPMLQDIMLRIPAITKYIDVSPFVEDVDPVNGTVSMGWNLYVLGTKRMYLGSSTHKSVQEFQNPAMWGKENQFAKKIVTPEKIIKFISEELSSHDLEFIEALKPINAPANISPSASSMNYNSYSERFKPQFY